MKVPASNFGDNENTCYIPIFDHGLMGTEDSQTVIVGNIFLEKYYLVYDMSPLEKGEDYI